VGSNTDDDNEFLRAIKSVVRIRRGSKVVAPCRKIYGMLKIPAEYDRDTSPAKLTDISRQVSPCFATRCLCWYLPESCGGWIRND